MNTSKKLFLILLLLLAVLFPCFCTSDSQVDTKMLESNLNQLQNLLTEQSQDLMMLRDNEVKSQNQIKQLENLLNTKEEALTKSDEALKTMQQSLTEARSELQSVSESLTSAKQSLNREQSKLIVSRILTGILAATCIGLGGRLIYNRINK